MCHWHIYKYDCPHHFRKPIDQCPKAKKTGTVCALPRCQRVPEMDLCIPCPYCGGAELIDPREMVPHNFGWRLRQRTGSSSAESSSS